MSTTTFSPALCAIDTAVGPAVVGAPFAVAASPADAAAVAGFGAGALALGAGYVRRRGRASRRGRGT
ncbi:MAG: hypothetical protein ACRDTP_04345 [Mycobacteriales bacterium]